MSDLVENTEDRFSRDEAHMSVLHWHTFAYFSIKTLVEPHCEKTGLRDFRPGLTQTRLCSHRRWLEA